MPERETLVAVPALELGGPQRKRQAERGQLANTWGGCSGQLSTFDRADKACLMLPHVPTWCPQGAWPALCGHWRIPEGIRPSFHLQEPRRRNTSFTKKTGHRCRDAPRRPSAIEVHTRAGADTLCSQVSQSQCGRCSPKPQRTGYSAACGSPGSAGRPCARVQPVPGEQSRTPTPVVRWDNSEASEMGAEGTHGGSTLLSAHFTDLSHFPHILWLPLK